MVFASQPPASAFALVRASTIGLFFGGFGVLIVVMRLWARRLAGRVDSRSLGRSVRRFSFAMFLARTIVAAWFVVGLYGLGWGAWVLQHLVPTREWPVMTP